MSTYLLDDLAQFYLPGAGLGLTFASNLFASLLPDSPDNATSLLEYPGRPPEYLMGTRTLPVWEYPRVQVVVRNVDYHAGRALIESVARSLESITNLTVNTTTYLRVSRLTNPTLMHRDEKRRCYFVVNLECERVPS